MTTGTMPRDLDAPVDAPSRGSLARRTARAAWLGFFVDMFDVYLPVIALAPAIRLFEPPGGFANPQVAALVFSVTFAATLLGRPIGSLIFGWLSDRIGRRPVTLIAVLGFATATLLIACLPGYATAGPLGLEALILLRFVAGIFLAGEYTAAMPLAMEYSPRERRAVASGFIMTSFPLAYVAISGVTYLLLRLIPSGSLGSPYTQWGWRLPFLLGAAIAYAFAAYWYAQVPESESWGKVEKARNPLLELARGADGRAFVQVFTLMSGLWFLIYMIAAVIPATLAGVLKFSHERVTFTMMLAFVVIAAGYVAAAAISQVIGRRPFYILAGLLAALGGTASYLALIRLGPDDVAGAVWLTALFGICVAAGWSIFPAYLNERFRTSIRSSGFGVAYSLSVVIPSFFSGYQAALGQVMPAQLTAVPLIVLGGLLLSVGGYWGPETRDVDLRTMA